MFRSSFFKSIIFGKIDTANFRRHIAQNFTNSGQNTSIVNFHSICEHCWYLSAENSTARPDSD